MSRGGNKKPVGFATHITAGGIAGACEAVCPSFRHRIAFGELGAKLACQPLDTIKVRMQLSRSGRVPGVCCIHIVKSHSYTQSIG